MPLISLIWEYDQTRNVSFAVQFLREEIVRAEALGATQITLHPGAHVGQEQKPELLELLKA